MHPLGTGNPAPPAAELCMDSGASIVLRKEGRGRAKTSLAGPFVERRRQRPVEHTWHQALESVHSLFIRYEETNQLLTEAEENYRSLFESALIGIFRIRSNGQPSIVNHAMARICGYDSPEQMLAEVSNIGEQMFVDQNQWLDFIRVLHTTGLQCGIEAETNVRNGARKWVQLNVRAIREDGRIAHYEGTAEDITDRKKAQERIRHLAYYDLVTGLPNRPLFEERFSEALSAARWKAQGVALLLLEVGRFKMINDSLGKIFGDRLLQEIAERIRTAAGERATVARLGGAEFAIFVEDVKASKEAEQTARQVISAVNSEFAFLGHTFNVSCTMGISKFPDDGRDGHTLLERADVALYSAKEHGANEFQFFSAEIDNQIRERLRLENALRLALERNELFLVYQVQVNTRTGEVSGLEALLRWTHPELGLVPPGDFIDIAESSGLIVPIGEWVLRTACTQARRWQDAGLPAVPVAVNVSAVQFRHHGFCDLIRRVLNETGLDAKYLELELTEGLLMSNVDVMFTLIQELREMGVKLAIDDFGTGYSSLNYLRQFKVNRLKIDRSFVREVHENSDDAAITTAIINMAKALNLDVLAEGVENVEQLDFLRAQNCYDIQGFYFSKPVAVDQVGAQLQTIFTQQKSGSFNIEANRAAIS
jgi:diguanylate cyclase (GGDEF)-like protein/PAS domain S-box-containing protein